MSTWQGFIPLFWSLWEHNKYNKTLWVRIPIPTSSPSSYCDFFDLGFQPTNLSWCWGVYALACSRLLDSEEDAKVFPPVFFACTRFLNSADPTISEPGTGYVRVKAWKESPYVNINWRAGPGCSKVDSAMHRINRYPVDKYYKDKLH